MLADPTHLGNVAGVAPPDERLFEPAFWAARGELIDVSRGRGSAWFVSAAPQEWALRHYRRGGLIARLSADRYLWAGEARVRAFAEWRLLAALVRRELPVPQPLAARYQRGGLLYRCDLITRRVPGALPLSARLERAALGAAEWRGIGATAARFHAAGVDHADLNAHNILIDDAAAVTLIDFDRGRLRAPASGATGATWAPRTAWATRNLLRLQRSLAKVGRELPAGRCGATEWQWLLDGYCHAPRL